MILEQARLQIAAGQEGAFEAAFDRAQRVLARAAGYLAHELLRSLEQPQHYTLLVEWQSEAHHTEGFRGSADFQHWRALLTPYITQPPQVEHYRLVAGRGLPPPVRPLLYQD